MLQQILDEMWIDPELLAELDESQKQILFCRMREEQVRKWRILEEEQPLKPPDSVKSLKKKVGFLLDVEGDPWTWVMGEHPDDKSVEQILEEEAQAAARRLAEEEAQTLRLSMEAELTELLELNKKQREEIEVAEQKLEAEHIYCSADELRSFIRPAPKPTLPAPISTAGKQTALGKSHKVSQRVALWEKRLMEERTSEIYQTIQKKKQDAVKESEEHEQRHELVWREQQKKANKAENHIREIARRAREEHRRSMQEADFPLTLPADQPPTIPPRKNFVGPTPAKPPNREAIVEWFKSTQISGRAGLQTNSKNAAIWFHGLISRQEAENLLQNQPKETFLVRLSERIWGYAVSYKDTDRCKHYLIDASNGRYQFLGTNQISHNSLSDLVHYHKNTPITAAGFELLVHPCQRFSPLPPELSISQIQEK